MKTRLRVLHIEDSPRDADLIHAKLEEEGFDCDIISARSRVEFEQAMEHVPYDLILSDYSLPDYDGMTALKAARKKQPDVPFILLSGTLGEEQAVESLRNGANDYILKQRLIRLVPAVRRALGDAETRAERKRTEEKLRESQELFRRITESVDDLIAVLDLDGKRVFSSPSYERLLGKPELLIGTDSFVEIHPEDRERIRHIFQETVASGNGQRTEYRFMLKDGTVRFIESQGSVIRDSSNVVRNVLVVSRDITARKQVEQQVSEQAALLDKAQDAINVCALDGRILYWNKSAERVYGWTADEAINRNVLELLFNEVAPQFVEAREKVVERGEWMGELRKVAKDGRTVIVESRWTLVRDANGHPKSTLVIDTDVTEKRKLEAQFLRTQRMESVGALASGIAHDLNNVLAPILMVSGFLQPELKSEEGKKMLEMVTTSARRGADMVKQILSFTRGVAGEHTVLQVKHLITEMGKLAKDTFPRSIQIQTQVSRDICPIKGDATQLHQVLLNLCVNARDAMPEGGTLLIKADNILLQGKRTPMRPEPVSGPYLVVSVQDSGQGIPSHLLDKIFEPFFTTKETGKGTGLGLSTVISIVKVHNGFVEVSSEVGKGTDFRVYFPVTAGSEAGPAETQSLPTPTGHGEQILLVEDEAAIMEITRETLNTFNYRILTAKNGAEAVNLFLRHRADIKVVLMDMMMPVMDGYNAIQALRGIDPHVKIICVSGMNSTPGLPDAEKLSVQASLKKPYAPDRLLTTLHDVLTNGSPNGS